jgi:RsiW-degrading membrane proteinase PrsW (M82 family)
VVVAVISAPIAEETLKWAVVRFGAYNRKEFNEPLDGFVYGATAALGFATLENVVICLFPKLAACGLNPAFLETAILRALFSVLGHAIYTSASCFFLGLAKFGPKGPRRYALVFSGLGLAIAPHAS